MVGGEDQILDIRGKICVLVLPLGSPNVMTGVIRRQAASCTVRSQEA
jgi:hypothetical protein